MNSVWTRVETSRLKRLLLAVATVDEEPEGEYQITPYYISKALDALNARANVTEEKMAQFEFLYASLLGHREYRVKNLELQVAKEPEFFCFGCLLWLSGRKRWQRGSSGLEGEGIGAKAVCHVRSLGS